ncbi:MAG: hypothetical protein HeimAB125_02780 [Candidatus Heimdallarchaeota archaeon AB_125]|nr:MAG: hypothetical protein HeimAB125_02780 [Candidatus Heimdallarchaeota archaeon AB_125]
MEEPTLNTSLEVDGQKYHITAVFLENAVSIFIYDETPRLGTLAISVPGTDIMQASTLYVTGSSDAHFVRMLGERFATRIRKLVLLSISLKEISNELVMKIMQKTEQLLFEEKNEK